MWVIGVMEKSDLTKSQRKEQINEYLLYSFMIEGSAQK